MFRGIAARSVRSMHRFPAFSPAVFRSTATGLVRLNSTKPPKPLESAESSKPTSEETNSQKAPPSARRIALDKADDLRRDWDAKVITYDDFLVKTQNPSEETFIIDVREKEEVLQGMIPSAVNLPLSVLGSALKMPRPKFKEQFGFEKPRTWQEVIFYCRSGMRSSSASDVAKRNDYTKILNYKGSWLEWTEKQGQKPSS